MSTVWKPSNFIDLSDLEPRSPPWPILLQVFSSSSASKAGVEALTKVSAKEFGKFNIRVNSLVPGFIDTDLIKDVPQEAKLNYINNCAMKRVGTVDEVAEVIAFLASDSSSYINGSSIDVNGG